jgi:hypothetical protein
MGDVLVKYDGNWADEIDLQGFIVMTDAEWKDYKKVIQHLHSESEFTVGIGTNEDVTFANADDYFDSFEVKKLTAEESATLRKFFKSTISFYDPIKKKETKLVVAFNGVIALKCPDEWEVEDDTDDDEIEDPE